MKSFLCNDLIDASMAPNLFIDNMTQIWEEYGYIPITFNVAVCAEHTAATPASSGVIGA